MLGALRAIVAASPDLPVDTYWLFTIAEEVGVGASSILTKNLASLVTIDNGTAAPEQKSAEFGVTSARADMAGPFDYHLMRKLAQLCQENEIRFQKGTCSAITGRIPPPRWSPATMCARR